MRLISHAGRSDIATVYIFKNKAGRLIETVESVQPPLPREKKWVIIVSTLYGCPVKCQFCEAGSEYFGKLDKEDIFHQIDFIFKEHFPDTKIRTKRLKVQFARMGEPSFNDNVLDVLMEFPKRYEKVPFEPAISTIAPDGTEKFFEALLKIKKKMYDKDFQLQFSIHSTDESIRDQIIPVKKWSFEKISEYGKRFFSPNGKKITLNFAINKNSIIDPNKLIKYFQPDTFLIKITPINPTENAFKNDMISGIEHISGENSFVKDLKDLGYHIILSIGELDENLIGSNCGQYVSNYKKSSTLKNAYTYWENKEVRG